jgi:CubicO group peptidase (beta-lactamase class C family)
MTRKRIISIGVIIILLSGLVYGIHFGLRYAYIATSYASKTVCSCVFVSGRDFENVKSEDLYAVAFVNVKVDENRHEVTSDLFGFAKARAIYREGMGCTLVNGSDEQKLWKQPRINVADNRTEIPELPSGPVPGNMDSLKLFQAIDEAFTEDIPPAIKRTRAVIILHEGKIIAERYARGITPGTPLLGWSMTKSVTNAMIGILVKDNLLNIHQSAPVKEWQNDNRKNITIDQILRMSSGLSFEENYAKPCDATQMLFREQSCGNYALKSRAAFPPDEMYYYSSGTTNILQEIIRRQFASHEDYLSFPYKRLFRKIGMKSAVLEPDASGTYIGSSFMYATARDWSRFGQFYLQDGVWNGERILPEGWARYSGTETPKSGGRYAAHFWVNHIDKDFPQDAYYADGFEGQFVTIIPSKQMVIVRLGCTHGALFDNTFFVKDILKSLK